VAFLLLGGLSGCSPRGDATGGAGLAETNSQSPVSTGDSGRRKSEIQPAQSSPSPGFTIAGKGELPASNRTVEIQRAADASKGRLTNGADVVPESRVNKTGPDGYPVPAGGIVAGSGAEKRDSSTRQAEPPSQPAEPILANTNAVPGSGGGSTQAIAEVIQEEPPSPAVLVSRHVMVGASNQVVISYTMEVDQTKNEAVSGMVLSQVLPRGWSLVQSQPPSSAFDTRSRVLKWLLVPDQFGINAVELIAVSEGETSSPVAWNEALCWYTYRRASDGRSMTFNAVTR